MVMGVNNQTIYQMTIPVNDIMKQATGIDDVKNASTEYVSVAQVFNSESPVTPFIPPDGCFLGTFTPSEDSRTYTVLNPFDSVPKMAMLVCATPKIWEDIDPGTILTEELVADPQTGEFDINAGSGRYKNNVIMMASNMTYLTSVTYTTYPASMDADAITFATGRYYNGLFKAGYTYLYILIK